MQTKKQEKPYTIENESQFPFLIKISHFKKAKQHGLQQKTWTSFLTQSASLMTKWFNWSSPQFILVEVDQKNRNIKFYEKHESTKYISTLTQRKWKGSIVLSEVRNFNQKIELDLKKNFVNGSISPSFTYNWVRYSQQEKAESDLDKVYQFGVQFNLKKWLSNSLTTNEKKIFFGLESHLNSSISSILPFQKWQSSIYLANRANYHQGSKPTITTDSIVKQTSDIIGYNLIGYNFTSGLQLSLKGGYDHFHRYNFNKLMLKFGNFKEFESHVIEMSLKAGTVFGKNLMENDLLNRSKSRWVDDRSVRFISTRFNFIFKNFHPIFGGVFQIVPFFYLQGIASQNLKQPKTKYELDYGIGLRFLNVGLTIDTSLLRMGKNLDQINPSFRIVF